MFYCILEKTSSKALLEKGREKFQQSRYDDAAKYFTKYIERHTEADRREGLLEALLGLGQAKGALSKYEESAKYFSQYVEVHTEVDSREDLLQVLLRLGLAKYELSQYEESAKYNSMYIERHKDVDRREGLLEALMGLGAAKYQLSQYEEAAKYYSMYIERHTDDDRREYLLEALLRLGLAKYDLSQYEEAAKYCSMYIERHTEDDRREGLLTVLLRLGCAKYKLSQYEEAAKYYSMYIESHTDGERREGLLLVLQMLGKVKYELSQYEESAKYFSQYLELHTEADSREDLLYALRGLGAAKYDLSQYEEAAKYYSMYIEMDKERDNREDFMKVLLLLGRIKHQLSQYEESAKYYSMYMERHTDVDKREHLLEALMRLGEAKYKLSQYEEAAKYFSMYIERHKDVDRREGLLEALFGLGVARNQLSQYEEAAKYYSMYIERYTDDDRREQLLQALLGLGEAKYKLSEYEESAKYNSMYIERYTEADRREHLLIAIITLGHAKYQLLQYEESARHFSQYVELHTEGNSREDLLEAYLGLGLTNHQLSKFEEAARYFSMYIERHTDDDRREGLLEALLRLGLANHRLSQYEEAAKYLSIYIERHTDVDRREDLLQALLGLGLANLGLSKYEESSKYFSQYVEVHTEVDRREWLLDALLGLGGANYQLSQYEEATKYFSEYIERHTDADRREHLLEVLLMLGDTKLQKNDRDGAIQLFEKYSSIANEISEKRVIVKKYQFIGSSFSRKMMFTQSVKWLKKGLSLAKELNDIDSQLRISKELLSVYTKSGENKDSISLVDSLKDEIDNGEKSKDKPEHFVRFLVMKSRREYESGLLDEAYKTGLRAISSSKGDEDMHVQCLLNLADVGLAKELYDDVKINLEKALQICEHKACFIDYKMAALCTYAKMHHDLHQYDMAQEKASELFETALGTGDKMMQSNALLLLGWASSRKGNLVGAEMFCQEMEKFSSNIQNPILSKEVFSLSIFMEVYNKRGNIVDVLSMVKKLMETQLAGASTVPIRYDWLIRFFMKLIDDPNVKEQLMSQFTDILKKILVHNEKISSSYGEHDDHRVAALTEIIVGYKLLVQLLIDDERTDEAIVFADRGRMCILQDILQQKYCMDVTDESENEKLDLGGIREIAVKENCCIVFYLMMEECLMIWIISEKGIECEKITKFVSEESELLFERETNPAYYLGKVVFHLDEVVGQASAFRGADSTDPENVETAECGDEDLMIPESTLSEYRGETGDDSLMSCNQFELLYDWLIAPIQDKLIEDKILIIPDNFMFQIPFIALKDKKTGKHLADMKSVRLAPSLMTLQILNDPSSNRGHSKEGALVVAADDVGKVKYKGEKTTFKKLKYAAKEAKVIGKLLNVDPFIGKKATKRAVVEQLSRDYKVLHIAAHGKFPGKIILTPNETSTGGLPRQDDYILDMSDVMKIGVRAQLVVLSCCSSGDGQQTAEGIIGFGRAFLAAGARAVLVALWRMKDKATFLLMQKFYECFVDGKSASDSLSEAVRALKSIKQYKEERKWGPYILLGCEVYWNESEPAATNITVNTEEAKEDQGGELNNTSKGKNTKRNNHKSVSCVIL